MGEPTTLTAEACARGAQALRILERLAHEVFSSVQDAATDLELLAPDDDTTPTTEPVPDVSVACYGRICTECRVSGCKHACHTEPDHELDVLSTHDDDPPDAS